MESSGTVQVAVLRSGNTEEQNVVTVHSRALESSASGFLSPNTVPYSGFFCSVKFRSAQKIWIFRLLRAHMHHTPTHARAGRAEKYSF